MTLETFFAKFDRFADAPDAVAKIRELVLQLAVQGKLVERKESDGNAAKMFSDGLPAKAASRYEIAETWLWIRFAAVGEQRLGKMLDQKGNRGELKPYLRNTNVQWMRFQLDDIKELRLESDELDEYRLLPGDLLICEGGEPGRCAIWRDRHREMYFQKAIHRVRPRKGILSEYLAICLQVDAQNGVLDNHFTGATIKHFTGRSLSEYSIPLPPLAEQKRIVAKVDELMALCDRLEAQQQEREARHAALACAALARFADAPTPANLQLLFHSSYAIAPADLRKTILSLAILGRLVPQDPNDEPVDAENRQGRAVSGVEAPEGWNVAPLGEVAEEIVDCPHSTPRWTVSGKICVRTNQFRPGVLDLSETKFVSEDTFRDRIRRLRPREDDILYSREGGILGIACRVPPNVELCLGQRMMLIRAGGVLNAVYLELVLNAPLITEIARSKTTGGAAPRVNVATVKSYPIPIPPLAEQRRIVAKVGELMAMVEQLETQLAASRATAANLLSAVVAELTSSG